MTATHRPVHGRTWFALGVAVSSLGWAVLYALLAQRHPNPVELLPVQAVSDPRAVVDWRNRAEGWHRELAAPIPDSPAAEHFCQAIEGVLAADLSQSPAALTADDPAQLQSSAQAALYTGLLLERFVSRERFEAKAAEALQLAKQCCERLLDRAEARHAGAESELRDRRYELAAALRGLGRVRRDASPLRAALDVYRKLPADDTRVALEIARTWAELAGVQSGAEAEAACRSALELEPSIRKSHGKQFSTSLAPVHLELARLLVNAKRSAEAEAAFRTAVERFREVDTPSMRVANGSTWHGPGLADAVLELSRLLADTNRAAEAEAGLRESIAETRSVVEGRPDLLDSLRALAQSQTALADLLAKAGRRDPAADRAAREAWQRVVFAGADRRDVQALLSLPNQ